MQPVGYMTDLTELRYTVKIIKRNGQTGVYSCWISFVYFLVELGVRRKK